MAKWASAIPCFGVENLDPGATVIIAGIVPSFAI